MAFGLEMRVVVSSIIIRKAIRISIANHHRKKHEHNLEE